MVPKVPSLLGALLSLLAISEAFQSGPTTQSWATSLKISSDSNDNLPLEAASAAARQLAGTAAFISTVAFGVLSFVNPVNPAMAASAANTADPSKTIQVQLDAPVLLKRLKSSTYQRELLDALREVQDVIGPDAITITPPRNTGGAFRDLLSGKGEISVNGQPVDIAVINSNRGEITVRVSNSLLPKVPILSSSANIPFLSSTSSSGSMDEDSDVSADESKEFDLKVFLARAYGFDTTTPFFDQQFFHIGIPIPRAEDMGGPFTYYPTNKDVAGSSSLALGAIYASAYAYHNSLIEKEDEYAAKARAAKVKTATAAKKEAAAVKAAAEKEKEAAAVTSVTTVEPVNDIKPEVDNVEHVAKEQTSTKRSSRLRRLLGRGK